MTGQPVIALRLAGRAQGHHFRMRTGIMVGDGPVKTVGDQLVISDYHSTDRHFSGIGCPLSPLQRLPHPLFILGRVIERGQTSLPDILQSSMHKYSMCSVQSNLNAHMLDSHTGITRIEIADSIIASLRSNQEELRRQWVSPEATTTRHFLLDDLLSEEICEKIYHAFPKDFSHCRQLNSFRERKKTLAKYQGLDPIISEVTYAFQDPGVIEVIEEVTELEALEGDPRLYAGGISIMSEGDFLNPHIDNSHDAKRQRYRRLNLLYYVTPDWQSECGGNLELWDARVRQPREIVSRFNRLVVMATDASSWHSVNPVKVDAARCCVSNYYFSGQSPSGQDYYHVTSFRGRPDQPFRRIWGRIDNRMRQTVATLLGISRGMGEMPDSSQTT